MTGQKTFFYHTDTFNTFQDCILLAGHLDIFKKDNGQFQKMEDGLFHLKKSTG